MTIRVRFIALSAVLLLPLFLNAAGVGAQAVRLASADVTDANVTRLTADLLTASQFAHQPLDDKLASSLLERYLELLDADRSLFLQSDVAGFAAHRGNLANDIRLMGDTRLAHVVFARYLERLGQRAAFVEDTLRTDAFDFTGDAVYVLDREHAARPIDLAAARELWRLRLRFEYLQEKLAGKDSLQIATTLRRRIERQLQAMQQERRDAVLETYLSALANVYDPHSDYMGRQQLGEFDIAMSLSLIGIGARLMSEEGHCKIVELVPGGPAERSGLLHPGDRIVAVAQAGAEPVDIIDLPLARAVALIRGKKGSVVNLTIIPAAAGDDSVRVVIPLVRDEVRLDDQRAKSTIVDLPRTDGSTVRLGVIDLPSFYATAASAVSADGGGSAAVPASATVDVALLLKKLKDENVQGVVLDLRRNGGGSLDEAIDLTGLFISRGPVVQTRGPAGEIEVGSDSDPSVAYHGPLLVLTSRFSASASEILAGALQDYGRAVIAGDSSTFGKGTVQTVMRLAPMMDRSGMRYLHDPGALKVTIRKFYRPSGASTQLAGVVPDIVLPSLTGRSDVGESVLGNPLPWDTVPSSDYDYLNLVDPHLHSLREASARRVANSRDFAYLHGEITRQMQRLASGTVSLNEATRRQEIADAEARRQAYEQALLTHAEPVATRYEISVREAALPGLPPSSTLHGSGGAPATAAPGAGNDGTAQGAAAPSGQRDFILNEAKRILADYVLLLGSNGSRAVASSRAREAPELPAH